MNSVESETANVVLQSLDTGEQRVLIPGGADARYVSTGHLVYMKTGTLMAVPFDVQSRQVTGAPVALIEGVMQGGERAQRRRRNRSGTVHGVRLRDPALRRRWHRSDSRKFAGVGRQNRRRAAAGGRAGRPVSVSASLARWTEKSRCTSDAGRAETTDVWVYDVVRGTPTRLTFDGDNRRSHLVSRRQTPRLRGKYHRRQQPLRDQRGRQRQARASHDQRPAADSVFMGVHRQRDRVFGATGSGTAVPLESGFFHGGRPQADGCSSNLGSTLTHPEFSPDGHWMAYVSNESGAAEVYVQAYPGPGEKIRISTAGGIEPIWTANGRELLYRAHDRLGPGSFSPRRSAPCLRSGPTRLACCSRPSPVNTTVHDAHSRLGCQRRRPAVPPAATGWSRRTSRSP